MARMDWMRTARIGFSTLSLIHISENVQALNALIAPYTCITRVELLPFHKLCTEKYDRLGLPFPFARYPAATQQCVDALQSQIVLPQHT